MMMRLHDNLHSISTERTISGKVKELMTNMSQIADEECSMGCLLYTSDAADE